ncbi:hypothetical protein HHL23_12360 [Chryseobacterium sp. RP-3-3]|uniref:Uncharacterized protein n=1 Tax=Chryseobacterium antibioticum TaxID=2728847 RepID=A0A7Y0ANR6_9FLAO|nr:hypothetical protein [Chryseobacterium antibioticum]NML70592.1 hypothetical protein [Chryseobacterium antibioticum]
MKKTVFILLYFSQAALAQHKKKIPPKVPLEKQIEHSFTEEELLNDALKGSTWYFDLKNYDQTKLSFDKDKVKPDVLYFVDAKKFQISINQKNCKSLIKGTYQIMKKMEEPISTPVRYHPFKITSPYQKCVAKLSDFLWRDLDISLNETKQIIEMKAIEDVPPITLPGF